MAMLQQEPTSSSPNDNDSLNRSNNDVSTMEGTTTNTKQPPTPKATQEEATEDVSQLDNIPDSNEQPETRPEHQSTTVPKEDTNQVPVVTSTLESLHNNTANTSVITGQPNMKLIVRSQYWGRTLKGKTCRSAASMNRAYRTISAQAVLYNTDEYWGCCPHHGKRVLELQECHFQDVMPDQNWDLYSTGMWSSPNYCVNDFFLLPQNQNIIDVSRNIILDGWAFMGTCMANSIRDDLDSFLRPWLAENDKFGYRYHHVHIEIMMDKAFDRETPRSRKVNNEKARQERQQVKTTTAASSTQDSSEATDETGSSSVRDGPPSAGGNPFVMRSSSVHGGSEPPIPHVISNDSSSVFSHSVASSAIPYPDGYSGVDSSSFWSPPAPPGMHPAVHHPHPGIMQWHRGRNHPLASPIPQHHHHHHASWPSPSGLPPPPPMHGQMHSPSPMSHHSMTELQQFLMYSDPINAGSVHSHHNPHHPHPHHPHQYYPTATPSPLHHQSQQQQHYYPTYGGVPHGAHVPSEILSSPTRPAPSTFMPPASPHFPAVLHAPQLTAAVSTSAPPVPATTTISSLEAGIANMSVTNNDSTDSVVTTVASNTMVTSTCWSKVAAAGASSAATSQNNGATPSSPTKKNGRVRLPTAD